MHWVQNLMKRKSTAGGASSPPSSPHHRRSPKKMGSTLKNGEVDGEGSNRCFGSKSSNKRKIYRRASKGSRNRFYRKEMSSTEGESSFGSDLETSDSPVLSRRSRHLKSQTWRVENLRDAPPTKDEWWQECPWETVHGSYDDTEGGYDQEHGYEHAYSYDEAVYYDDEEEVQPGLSCSYDYSETECGGFGVVIGNGDNNSPGCGVSGSAPRIIHETRSYRKFHNCGYETWVRAREEWNKQTVANIPPKPAMSTSNMTDLVKGLGKATAQRTYALPRRMALSDVINAYTVIWQGDDY